MEVVKKDGRFIIPGQLQLIAEGYLVTIPAGGVSMRPFIEDGRDKLVFGPLGKLSVGDVILAEVTEEHYVCHRIEKIEGDIITMRGDGILDDGTERTRETFPASQARASLLQVVRKGKTYTLATSRVWKCYSAIWVRLLPIRRYLLALYRLLWLHQLPQRWTHPAPSQP